MAKKTGRKVPKKAVKKGEKKQAAELPAIEETKPKKEPEKKGFSLKETPKHVLLLGGIAAILLGLSIGLFLSPKEPVTVIVQPPLDKNVSVTILFDEKCTFCAKYNTILDVFNENFIPYKVEEVSVNSPEGIKAVAKHLVKIIPTALVEISGMENYPEIKAAMDQSYTRIGGKYVVPELNLNSNKIYSREYLQSPVPQDCNSDDARVRVNIFDDPFNEISIKSTPELNKSLDKLDSNSLNIVFEFIPSVVSTVSPDQNRDLFNKNIAFLYCSSAEGKFREMHDWILGYYCDQGQNPANLTEQEILFCNAGSHFGKLLTIEELENARISSNVTGIISHCADLIEIANRTSLERAVTYSLRIPTTAVVDCRYNVPFKAIDEAVCLSDPSVSGCSQ